MYKRHLEDVQMNNNDNDICLESLLKSSNFAVVFDSTHCCCRIL